MSGHAGACPCAVDNCTDRCCPRCVCGIDDTYDDGGAA